MPYIFQSIENFRDLGETVGWNPSLRRWSKVGPSILFRSATLDQASETEVQRLISELDVKTIIDLRSEMEAKLQQQGAFVSFPATAILKSKPSDMMDPKPQGSDMKVKHHQGENRHTVMINFAGKKFRRNAVWKSCPLPIKLKLMFYYLTGRKNEAVRIVGQQVINKKGLIGLYHDFIDYCDKEICQALKILADPRNYPILIHCTQGKDRTGLVTALALGAIGMDIESIVRDYALSQEGLSRERSQMVNEMAKDGLDPAFADAPPEIMRDALRYIDQKYDSILSYLDKIGLNAALREQIKNNISPHGRTIPLVANTHPVEALCKDSDCKEETAVSNSDKPIQVVNEKIPIRVENQSIGNATN